MSDSSRTITIKFTSDTKGLITGAAIADKALGSVGKKNTDIKKLTDGLQTMSKLGDPITKFGLKFAAVEAGIQGVVAAGKYLEPMIGLIGLLPGAAAVAAGAFAVLKLGSDGIKAAFKGVGDETKKSVSDVFQKELDPGVKATNALLKSLTPSLKDVAWEMAHVGDATLETADKAKNVTALNTILGATKTVVGNVGGAVSELVSTFLTVAAVAAPIFAKLTDGAIEWSVKLDQKIQALAQNGKLAAWIQGGIDRFVDFKNKIVTFVKDVEPILKNLGGIKLQLFEGLGPALLPILTSISAFLKDHPDLADWIIGVGLALKILGPIVTGITAIIAVFDFVLDANPITLIILAIIALIAGFVALFVFCKPFRDFWIDLWNKVVAAVDVAVAWFKTVALPFLTSVWDGIRVAVEKFLNWFQDNVAPIFVAVWTTIKDVVGAVVDWFNTYILPFLQGVWTRVLAAVHAFGELWDAFWGSVFGKVIKSQFESLIQIIGSAWTLISGIFQTAFNAIIGVIGIAWTIISAVFVAAFTIIWGIIKAGWELVKGIFEAVWDVIKGVVIGVWDVIKGIINGALDVITGIFQVFAGLLTGNWSKVWDGIKNIAKGVGEALGGIFDGIASVFSGLWQAIVAIGGGIGRAFQSIVGTVGDLLGQLWNTIKRIAGQIGDVFAGIGNGIASGIKNALNLAVTAINGLIHGINAVSGVVHIPAIPDIPHLALGGTARSGQPYLVGENGPELFTPGQTGRVTDTGQTADLIGQSDGDVVFMIDGEVIARIAKSEINKSNRTLRAQVKAGSR